MHPVVLPLVSMVLPAQDGHPRLMMLGRGLLGRTVSRNIFFKRDWVSRAPRKVPEQRNRQYCVPIEL